MSDQLCTVALIQMAGCLNPEENLAKGDTFCRQAASRGADIALFPELFNVSYNLTYKDPANWTKHAIDQSDAFFIHFKNLAKELNMAIGLTYMEKWNPSPRNVLTLIDRHGNIAFHYAKVHLCSFDKPESNLTAGETFLTVTLDTQAGPVRISGMICFDREFPESARVLMLQGTEIILVPNACLLNDVKSGLGDIRIQQCRTRAFENMIGIAVANYAAPQNDGHSCAFDPEGAPLVIADEQEGVVMAEFNVSDIRHWQQLEVWGKQFRRPQCYKNLCE